MRVCYFGTYRAHYVRNRLMIDRLRQQGVEVIECHATLWRGIEDRENIGGGGWRSLSFLWRFVSAYACLLWRYLHAGHYDLMIVGYPGQPDMLLAWVLTKVAGKPLVWDVLMSIYLIAVERGLQERSPFTVYLIRKLEQIACHLPDWLIMDTQEYAHWFQKHYTVPGERIRLLPLGADDRIFRPLSSQVRNDSVFRCVYYGTFIPNHGVKYIIEAARILSQDPSIHFDLIGKGPDRDKVFNQANKYGLENVTFIDWMDEKTLVNHIANIDVCLGTFGKTPQALMTMQNKIHECMAMAKPVINGDSPVMHELFQHGEQIFLCERENGQSLAEAVLALKSDTELRRRLADQGYAYYQSHLSMERIGLKFRKYLDEFLS